MALGQLGKPNNVLLDTLLQLNDLVKSLNGKDFIEKIEELQQKTDEYNKAKSTTEPLIHALSDATKDNEKTIADLKVERNLLASAKADSERNLSKIAKAQAEVDHSRKELEKKLADAEKELAVKSLAVVAREAKAVEKQKLADVLVKECQVKLEALKKITG